MSEDQPDVYMPLPNLGRVPSTQRGYPGDMPVPPDPSKGIDILKGYLDYRDFGGPVPLPKPDPRKPQ